MDTLFTAVRAVTFMSGFVFLWGWVAWRLRALDARFSLMLPAWTDVPGVILMALGAALALASVATFVVRGRGTPAPFDPPRQFVAVGPYRYVRNPMYIGALTVLAGLGLYLNSGAVLLFSILWIGFAHLFVVVYEEPVLRRSFREPYEAYCRAVPRWIPRLGRAVAGGGGDPRATLGNGSGDASTRDPCARPLGV